LVCIDSLFTGIIILIFFIYINLLFCINGFINIYIFIY